MGVINVLLKLKNAAGTIINPATKEAQDAAQTTLNSVDAHLANIDSDSLQIVTNTASTASNVATTNTNLGAKADGVATSDTGTFSLIALIKRLLQRWNRLEMVRSADGVNSTSTTLAAGATFTGAGESIVDYAQVNLTLKGRPNVAVNGDAGEAMGSLFFEFSPDGGAHWDISVPIVVRTLGLFIPYPLINVGTHYRPIYKNDGGALAIAILGLSETPGTPTTQTEFRLNSFYLTRATKELARTLDQEITGSDPAALVRAATIGQRPDGRRVNFRAGGSLASNSTQTALGSNAAYTPDWVDLDQFIAMSAIVNANSASASGGVQFQFKAANLASPNLKPNISDTPDYIAPRTYNGGSVGTSFRVDKPAARWGRVVYVNGTTPQSSFLLSVNLETSSLSTDVQIAAPDQAITTSITVGTSAVQLDSTQLIGRLSFEVYSDATNANNQRVFVGYSNAVTTSGANRGRPVENGADFKNDLSLNKQIWAIASAAGMTVQLTQIGK